MTNIIRRRKSSSNSTTSTRSLSRSIVVCFFLLLLFGVTPVTTRTTTASATTSIIEKDESISVQHDNLRRVGPIPNSTTTPTNLEQPFDVTSSIIRSSSSPHEDTTHPHLRSTLEDSPFHSDVVANNRQLQNTCGILCATDVDCCSNSGGCNCCKITNNIAGTGVCTNEFECGRDSQCWDGPNTCVDNYVELQSALNLVNPGQTIKLCQNSNIQLREGQTLICHKSHITVECENSNCRIQRISGSTGRIMIFSGTDITLQRLTLIGGSSSQGGGGALFVQGTANLQGLEFQSNQVIGQGRGGAANIGSGSSRPAFSGLGNTAVAGCNGIFVRPNGPCYGTPVPPEDRFNNRIQGNTQCGIACFSDDNCKSEGIEGYCRMCDLEQSSATSGTCIINPNEDPRLLDQCSKPCTTDGDCSIQVGPCKTCEANKCIDDTQRVIVPSSRSCVMNQGMLRAALTSPTEQVVEICANTNIVLTSEILVTHPNKILRCQGDLSNGCVISRERGSTQKHRLLTVTGNGFSMRHITMQGGDIYTTGGAGGAINFVGVTKLEISHCSFIGNTAKTGGAIALSSLSSTTILQSNFGAGNGGGGCMNIVVKSTGQCLNF